jgi:hypothetical protein
MEKGTKGTAERKQVEKGAAQGETQRPGKAQGMTQKGTDEGKATAQTPPKSGKGTAQAPSREQAPEQNTKGTAETGKSREAAPKPSETARAPSGGHMQLSDQQQSSVHDTILKERNVNRVANVDFRVDVGARIPRHVHVAALPASVISIVPDYRNYRYFVVGEEICIVDPTTYEIAEVIRAPGRTTVRGENRGTAHLALTDHERMIILHEVNANGASTLGLGALTEGADVPRSVELRSFPETVVEQVPKLKGYKYIVAENRLAIVDPQSEKIELVIEAR